MTNRIKAGIWGLGRAGNSMHAKEIQKYPDLFEITAGYDTDPERRSAMQARCECRLFEDSVAFLADPGIDLISVATRSPDHARHGCQALETGKYVLLEKPIAMNMEDAQQLIDADRRFPGHLFLRHNRRFEAPFAHIREIIAEGLLGEIYEIKLNRQSYNRRNDWQTILACGGGQLNNWGPHLIDQALQFLESPVADVWCDLKKIAAVGDAEDHLKIILRGQNRRVIEIEISGGVALKQPEYIVFGTRGALTCTDNTIKIKHIDPAQIPETIKAETGNPPLAGGFSNVEPLRWIEKEMAVAPKTGENTDVIWEHLYRAIRENAPFPITLNQGLEVVRITELARSHAPVTAF